MADQVLSTLIISFFSFLGLAFILLTIKSLRTKALKAKVIMKLGEYPPNWCNALGKPHQDDPFWNKKEVSNV